MFESDIQIKTQHFDGPLSLLLHLIQKEEMDIRSLNITYITKQYLNYLERMRSLNFDMAGDFLYMAATLLYLKSETCLHEKEKLSNLIGNDENSLGIASKADLIRRLQDLQRFQLLGQKLWSLPKKGHEVFVHPKVDKKSIVNSILNPMDLNSLIMVQLELMMREKRKFTVVKRDRLSIKEKLIFLTKYLNIGESRTLFDLLEADFKSEKDRIQNIVITFISLLELARLNKINIFQNEHKKDIYIEVISSLMDFNVELADGFNEEDAEVAKAEADEEIKVKLELEGQLTVQEPQQIQ